MLATGSPQAPDEAIPRWPTLKEVEVRFAPAVRRPEASEREGRASRHPKIPRPLMLPAHPIMAVPDPYEVCVFAQVVNEPVGASGWSQMMRKPGTDASGAKRAAEIYVEPRLEPQFAKPPDPHETTCSRRKHQGVSARLGFYRTENTSAQRESHIGHEAQRMASALGEQSRAPRTWVSAPSSGHAKHQCR